MKNRFRKPKKAVPAKPDGKIDMFFTSLDNLIRSKISSNIQLELIFAVAFCLVLAFLAYNITFNMTRKVTLDQSISYERGIDDISSSADDIAERMLNDLRYKEEEEITDEMRENARYASENNPNAKQFNLNKAMENLIQDFSRTSTLKVVVTDLNGDILYKTENVMETSLDIFSVIKSAYDIDYYRPEQLEEQSASELIFVYPMNFLKNDIYLVIKDTPVADIQTTPTYSYNSSLAIFIGFLFFISGFLILTKNKMDYIQELSNTVHIISTGDLKYAAPVKGNDELTNLAKSINVMARDIDERIEEERHLEKTKQELITNVSHDLRTPLTSIIGYLGLAQSQKISAKQKDEYIDIAYSKSERLKELINELFEYTKLQSPDNKPNFTAVNLVDLLDQLIEEMIPMAEERGLSITKSVVKKDIFLQADVPQIVRLFENLISNAIKYSYTSDPILLSVLGIDASGYVTISIENTIDEISDEEISKMFERFYRLEKSRSSETGGSGLGLAISEGIVHLHEGKIYARKINEQRIAITVKLPVLSNP
ncbi:HAMP domain-containing sensor histidine kinase [Proteiniclasticum sp.]|uniref:sensor histidine kinase n=1 Tax=Proteiniclasticum sp. TaxID=2053595 RepID=UPI0028A199EA|nr:HAMP domain-containing sensor histidine kinase [Proteiniclasticum sp.]